MDCCAYELTVVPFPKMFLEVGIKQVHKTDGFWLDGLTCKKTQLFRCPWAPFPVVSFTFRISGGCRRMGLAEGEDGHGQSWSRGALLHVYTTPLHVYGKYCTFTQCALHVYPRNFAKAPRNSWI